MNQLHDFRRQMSDRYRNRGFSLFELLIVIAIIGILISISVVSYSSVQKKARDSARKSDMKAWQAGWEQYYADNDNSYPAACDSIAATYMPGGIPTDPNPAKSYTHPTCVADDYCFCAELDSAGSGNSDGSCDFQAATKDYFCVKALQ